MTKPAKDMINYCDTMLNATSVIHSAVSVFNAHTLPSKIQDKLDLIAKASNGIEELATEIQDYLSKC